MMIEQEVEMKKKLFVFVFLAAMLGVVAGCTPGTILVETPVRNSKAATPAPDGRINVPGVSIQVYAPGPNPQANIADAQGRVASTLLGIWHGIISPITLIMSFINKGGQMYEVHNDGSQYNLGFLVGVAVVFLILGVFAGSRRR